MICIHTHNNSDVTLCWTVCWVDGLLVEVLQKIFSTVITKSVNLREFFTGNLVFTQAVWLKFSHCLWMPLLLKPGNIMIKLFLLYLNGVFLISRST